MDIKTYREKKGLSQAAFAQLIVDAGQWANQSLISHYELDRKKPSPRMANTIQLVTRGQIKRKTLRPDLWG